MAITGTLDQMRIDAASMCEAITRTRGDRDATVAALWASVGALSGSVTALAVFAGVVVGAQAAISGAAAQAAAAALGPGAAAASVLALSAQIAGQIAAAGPAAVRGGWVTVIIFAILVVLVIAALIWFIAELLEVIFRNNDLAIARSNFTGELAAIRSAIARAAMVCCEFDASLPACSDF